MKSKNPLIYRVSTNGSWRISLLYQRIVGVNHELLTSVTFSTKQDAIEECVYMRTVLEVYGKAKWKSTRNPMLSQEDRLIVISSAKYQQGLQKLRSLESAQRSASLLEDVTPNNVCSFSDTKLAQILREKCGWTTRIKYPYNNRVWKVSRSETETWWFAPYFNRQERYEVRTVKAPHCFRSIEDIREGIRTREVDIDNDWHQKHCRMQCGSFRNCVPLCAILAETITSQYVATSPPPREEPPHGDDNI